MIYLPLPATDVRLKSLWLVMSLGVGLLLSYPLSLLLTIPWLILTPAFIFLIAIPGMVRPQNATLLYRMHNAGARIFSHYAKEFLLLVCFCIMSIALGKKFSTLNSTSLLECQSHWSLRGTQDVEKETIIIDVKPKGLVRNFGHWTMTSGYWWMILLLPFLTLLSIFESEPRTYRVPDNIYTLY